MNRKDFFRKGLAKAFSVMEEGVNEISETWKSSVGEVNKAEPEKVAPKKTQIKVPKPKIVSWSGCERKTILLQMYCLQRLYLCLPLFGPVSGA
jgi:hypothetical protein